MEEINPIKKCLKCKIGLFKRNFDDDDLKRQSDFEKKAYKETGEIPGYSCEVYYCPKCFKQFIE